MCFKKTMQSYTITVCVPLRPFTGEKWSATAADKVDTLPVSALLCVQRLGLEAVAAGVDEEAMEAGGEVDVEMDAGVFNTKVEKRKHRHDWPHWNQVMHTLTPPHTNLTQMTLMAVMNNMIQSPMEMY